MATIPNPKNIVEIHILIKEYLPESKTTSRKILEEGMKKIEQLEIIHNNIGTDKIADGFNPFFPKEDVHNVDLLINFKLGAKRVNHSIQWHTPEGKYSFNWRDGSIKKVI